MFLVTPSQPGLCSNKLTTEINACKSPSEPTCRPQILNKSIADPLTRQSHMKLPENHQILIQKEN